MKKISIIFPKDSEAVFYPQSTRTFGGATAQLYMLRSALLEMPDVTVSSIVLDYGYSNVESSMLSDVVFSFNENDNFVLKALKFLKAIHASKSEYIIQRGLTVFSCFLAVYCRIVNKKLIFMFAHDRESKGRYQKNNEKCYIFSLLLIFSHKLVVQSQNQKKRLPDYVMDKTVHLNSGYQLSKKALDRNKRKNILWVGRLESWKRPEEFISLAKSFPEYNFIMVAPTVRGKEKYSDSLIEKIREVRNIKLVPFVSFDKISDYFRNAILFVNTSKTEGFPNTFVQSMVEGTPILALKVDPDKVISRNNLGISCEDDKDLFYSSFRRIVTDEESWKKYSDLSYHYALQKHDIRKIAENLLLVI